MRDDELSKKITAALDAARVAGATSRAIHEHIHAAKVESMPGVADSLGELDAIRAFAEIEGIGRGLSASGHISVMAGVEAGAVEGGDAFITKAMGAARDGLLLGMRSFVLGAGRLGVSRRWKKLIASKRARAEARDQPKKCLGCRLAFTETAPPSPSNPSLCTDCMGGAEAKDAEARRLAGMPTPNDEAEARGDGPQRYEPGVGWVAAPEVSPEAFGPAFVKDP